MLTAGALRSEDTEKFMNAELVRKVDSVVRISTLIYRREEQQIQYGTLKRDTHWSRQKNTCVLFLHTGDGLFSNSAKMRRMIAISQKKVERLVDVENHGRMLTR